MIIPTFTCPFCETTHNGTIDMSGEMPTGILPQCDCPEFRADWEAKHRMEMERRKQLRRTANKSLVHVGRVQQPKGKRYR